MAPGSSPAGFRVESVVVGLGFVALGLLWTLSNLGQLDLLRTLRTWWPLSLVVWGALELVNTSLVRSGRAGAGAAPAIAEPVDLGPGGAE